jgi:hypothetical protein
MSLSRRNFLTTVATAGSAVLAAPGALAAPGDIRAPWATASGFGAISRAKRALSIHCAYGVLELKLLKVRSAPHSIRFETRILVASITTTEGSALVEFSMPISIRAGQTLTLQ